MNSQKKKKKNKKHDKIMLVANAKLNTILFDSYISHDKFVSVNYVLREYNETNEEKIS